MKIHLLTACTRPENLPRMAESLAAAAAGGMVDLCWHIQGDPERRAVGGQAIKNAMLEQIADGWVYIFDDDNLLHPDLFAALGDYLADRQDIALIVCAQLHRSGAIRRPHRRMLRQTHVDAGQVIIRRDAIGAMRIPLHYCGDGEFIEALANTLDEHAIVYIPEPVTYYNWLRPL